MTLVISDSMQDTMGVLLLVGLEDAIDLFIQIFRILNL